MLLHLCNEFDVWDNQFPSNGPVGFYPYDSDNGIVEANTGHNNQIYDAYEPIYNTGNAWYSNAWGGLPGQLACSDLLG